MALASGLVVLLVLLLVLLALPVSLSSLLVSVGLGRLREPTERSGLMWRTHQGGTLKHRVATVVSDGVLSVSLANTSRSSATYAAGSTVNGGTVINTRLL